MQTVIGLLRQVIIDKDYTVRHRGFRDYDGPKIYAALDRRGRASIPLKTAQGGNPS